MESGSGNTVVQWDGFLAWKQGKKIYGSTVRVVQKQVLYLSAGGLLNRKEGIGGQKLVRKTGRAVRPGPCPKDRDGQCAPHSPQNPGTTPRSQIICKSVYGFREKINLLF